MSNLAAQVIGIHDRKCSSCNEWKSHENFQYRKTQLKNDGYSYSCKPCAKKIREDRLAIMSPEKLAIYRKKQSKKSCDYVKKNPDKAAAGRKRWYEKTKSDPEKYEKYLIAKRNNYRSDTYYERYYSQRFGISFGAVREMHADQNGLCANLGCSKPISLGNKNQTAKCAVDHDHETGKVRGLLCTRCNCMLGHIEKNISLVPGMMNYLNKHRSE